MKDQLADLIITKIRTDGGTQMRAEIDEETVDDYAEHLAELPPVTVFYDGKTYWLASGFHRLAAHVKKGEKCIRAEVKSGTQRDAILHAAGDNATHGRRRTNADKRRAVETLVRDEVWGKWNDSEIGRRCAVDHKTVASVRASWEVPKIRTVSRNGTTYEMDTSGLSRREFDAMPEARRVAVIQQVEAEANEIAERACKHVWVCQHCGEMK